MEQPWNRDCGVSVHQGFQDLAKQSSGWADLILAIVLLQVGDGLMFPRCLLQWGFYDSVAQYKEAVVTSTYAEELNLKKG